MIRISVLVALLLALAGCVIPFGKSTGPGDYRSPYFSNGGSLDRPGQQAATGHEGFSLR
jgi:hypothetical protein